MQSAHDSLPHSALHFDAVRDYWWNLDYLKLIADRLDLHSVRSVLDVGAGIGHWGRVLAAVLPEQSSLVGVNQEAE